VFTSIGLKSPPVLPIRLLEVRMRSKEICNNLSDAELTLEEFSKYHPDTPCAMHYRAVRSAVMYGYPVFEGYAEVYPSLLNLKPRSKRAK
jgi:hypothetical protein